MPSCFYISPNCLFIDLESPSLLALYSFHTQKLSITFYTQETIPQVSLVQIPASFVLLLSSNQGINSIVKIVTKIFFAFMRTKNSPVLVNVSNSFVLYISYTLVTYFQVPFLQQTKEKVLRIFLFSFIKPQYRPQEIEKDHYFETLPIFMILVLDRIDLKALCVYLFHKVHFPLKDTNTEYLYKLILASLYFGYLILETLASAYLLHAIKGLFNFLMV